jgi:hypothetical protein
MTVSKEIRLFGDLWLSDPEHTLLKHELMTVKKLLPLIQRFEKDWDKDVAIADSKPTNLYPTCVFSFSGGRVLGLGAHRVQV